MCVRRAVGARQPRAPPRGGRPPLRRRVTGTQQPSSHPCWHALAWPPLGSIRATCPACAWHVDRPNPCSVQQGEDGATAITARPTPCPPPAHPHHCCQGPTVLQLHPGQHTEATPPDAQGPAHEWPLWPAPWAARPVYGAEMPGLTPHGRRPSQMRGVRTGSEQVRSPSWPRQGPWVVGGPASARGPLTFQSAGTARAPRTSGSEHPSRCLLPLGPNCPSSGRRGPSAGALRDRPPVLPVSKERGGRPREPHVQSCLHAGEEPAQARVERLCPGAGLGPTLAPA